MKQLLFVEIENFKTFGDKIRIAIDHPAVLIGPNNAGKTSVIQALALWNRGIKAWYDKEVRGQAHRKYKKERISTGINRLNILEIPIAETRFLWHKTRVRKGNTPIHVTINVGLLHRGVEKNCRLHFTQRDSEVIYCRPCTDTIADMELLADAAKLRFNLLYPMSGIETEEPLIEEGRINVLMGQGQTAQVLRNLCFKAAENELSGKADWEAVTNLMKRLFLIELGRPHLNPNRGTVNLTYRQQGVDSDLDISLAGRGVQQMLLIIAYLYSHKKSVLLIDEPDAHLELLRQKQVYEILKHVASDNDCQVIIATHSEVILEEAVETNLTLLINGEAVDLANRGDMKKALRTFGIDHYYKAKVLPRILYVEGSTDLANLKALAQKIGHPAYDILNGRLNYYYTCNIEPGNTLENSLDRAGGAFGGFKEHFYTLKHFVEGFKGIAILDSDGQEHPEMIKEDLAVVYWKDYELENYFITPEVILSFVDDYFQEAAQLFKSDYYKDMQGIIDKKLLEDVFAGDQKQLLEFRKMSKSLRRTLLKNHKMSRFAEFVFSSFAQQHGRSVLLKKSEFHRLIAYVNSSDIPNEVSEKLDLLVNYLKWEETG